MMEIIMIMWKDVCRLNFCVFFFFSIKKFYKSVSRWFEEEIKKKVENLIKKKRYKYENFKNCESG